MCSSDLAAIQGPANLKIRHYETSVFGIGSGIGDEFDGAWFAVEEDVVVFFNFFAGLVVQRHCLWFRMG